MEPKKARKWLEEQLGTKIKPREVYQKSDKLVRQFILKGGFDDTKERLDLLGIDENGNLGIIENKLDILLK